MRTTTYFLITLLLCVFLGTAVAQASPFTGSKGKSTPQVVEVKTKEATISAVWYTQFIRTVTKAQKDLRREMTTFARKIKRDPWGKSFWLFVGVAFLYGVIHALGPGHGKSVVFAYFLGRKGNIWKGFMMGNLLGGVHALSSTVLVFGIYLILQQSSLKAFDETGAIVQRLSYSMVTLIGLFLCYKAFRELRHGHDHSHGQNHGCACSDHADLRSITMVSIGTGLIPCPGAAIILTFAISLGVPHAGLASMVTLALGMGLTTSLFGLLSIFSRNALAYVAGKAPKAMGIAHTTLTIMGALGVTLLGAAMLSATM